MAMPQQGTRGPGNPRRQPQVQAQQKPQLAAPVQAQPAKPAWQLLREAGQQGTGSAAGNRAAAAQIANVPGRAPQFGTGASQGVGNAVDQLPGRRGPSTSISSFPMFRGEPTPYVPDQMDAPQAGGAATGGIDGAIANLRQQLGQKPQGPGGMGGGGRNLYGIPTPPGAAWQADPSMADTGGGMFRNAQGQPVDFRGRPLPVFGQAPGVGGASADGMGGPGSDLGFQSGGGLQAPPQPQVSNPYVNLLRQRLGGGGPATPGAVASGFDPRGRALAR